MSEELKAPETPECDRMLDVHDLSQTIGAFLDWLPEVNLRVCTYDEKTGEFYPPGTSINRLLAQYFDIDLDKVEREKRAILEWVRAKQEASDG